MPGIDLSTSFSILLAAAGIICAAVVGALSYRDPVPPLPRSRHVILIVLRSTALALLFLLLGQPIASLVSRWLRKPVVAVVVDNSQSMALRDGAGDRSRLLREAVSSEEFGNVGRSAELRWYLFDHRTRALAAWSPESLTFAGDRTDIASMFRKIRAENSETLLRAVVLLSDGNSTSAENPVYAAEELALPVFTVGVGDTTAARDVLVANLQTNAVAYARTRVPVVATIRSSGFAGQRAEIVLEHRGVGADRQEIELSGSGDQRVTVHFVPDSSGLHRTTVSVTRLDGETTHRNNAVSAFSRILSDKLRVLLISSAPSPDVSFMARTLSADSNLTVIVRSERTDGSFLEGRFDAETIQGTDVLVIMGLPSAATRPVTIDLLQNAEFRTIPVMYLPSRTTTFSALRSMAQVLPFTVDQHFPAELTVFVSVAENRGMHPVLKTEAAFTAGDWAALPPIFRPQATFRLRPGAEVLATVRLQSTVLQEPLLVALRSADRKILALTGYGIWRWKLLAPRDGSSPRIYDAFVNAAMRWLTSPEDIRRIRVRPTNESFSALEAPEFSGQVYDESMQPVMDAEVQIIVTGGGQSTTASLNSVGNGQYQGAIDILPAGEYEYTATVRSGSVNLGGDAGAFSVGGLNAEFLETRVNRPLLEAISHRTGGRYMDSRRLDGLAQSILQLPAMKPAEHVERADIDLWQSPWMLGFILALFTAEWALRKRLGML